LADKTLKFFEQRREWSKYKHLVLEYYLRPYLAHVNRRRAPILLVDLFAGPGLYEDGTRGSPLILADAATQYAKRDLGISVLAVEHDNTLFSRLCSSSAQYGSLVDARVSDFLEVVDEIAERAQSTTTFLYVDPFNTTRLYLDRLGRVFEAVSRGGSVEVLLVFMANAFLRCAGACLRAESDAEMVLYDKMVRDAGTADDMIMMARALWGGDELRSAEFAIRWNEELNAVAGGDYWREIMTLASDNTVQDRSSAFVNAYKDRLRQWFPITLSFPIYANMTSQLRKYWMVFCTRYEPAIDFINRAAATVRVSQYEQWKGGTLFADADVPPPADTQLLEQRILEHATQTIEWCRLRWIVSLDEVGAYTDSIINNTIKRMLKDGKLVGASGRRVEEKAKIRRA